jgi:hypothetical protein
MTQYVIIQGELAIAIRRFTETGNTIEVLPGDIEKVLSAPRGVYLHPNSIKFVGNYTIIEQKEKPA